MLESETMCFYVYERRIVMNYNSPVIISEVIYTAKHAVGFKFVDNGSDLVFSCRSRALGVVVSNQREQD